MNSEKIKDMIDVCYKARRILELLPKLPRGVAPSYIHYLDVIQALEKKQKLVKISDIAFELNLPKPGVTRTVKEMESKGYVNKYASNEDKRITYISISDQGMELYEKYNYHYFIELANDLNDISIDDADLMIETMEKFYQVMCKRRRK